MSSLLVTQVNIVSVEAAIKLIRVLDDVISRFKNHDVKQAFSASFDLFKIILFSLRLNAIIC